MGIDTEAVVRATEAIVKRVDENPDATADKVFAGTILDPSVDGELTWSMARLLMDKLADKVDEWQGLPTPIPGIKLILEPTHRLAPIADSLYGDGKEEKEKDPRTENWVTRNQWYSHRHNATVYVVQDGDHYFPVLNHRSRQFVVERLTLLIKTLLTVEAWSDEAESAARFKLREMIGEHRWRMYDLAGVFLETSARSGVTYMFRRLRPTLAFHGTQSLAALCLHPIGYYNESWSGALTPTDDVISHLVFMRGDEHGYWRRANQHPYDAPEAGI